MKTPKQFIMEYYQIPESEITTVRINSLIKCLERYKEYYDKQILDAITKTSSGMPNITDKWHMMVYRDEFKKELGLT